MLHYRIVTIDELNLVRDMLETAALRLQQMHVDQWAYWLDPPVEKLRWLEQGVVDGEYNFVSQAGEVVAMYRLSSEDLIYWGTQSEPAWYIHSLVALPSFAGMGIGSAIIKKVEIQAKEHRVAILRLDCHAGNPRLCQYYEDLGFHKVGEKLMPHSLNNLYEKRLID